MNNDNWWEAVNNMEETLNKQLLPRYNFIPLGNYTITNNYTKVPEISFTPRSMDIMKIIVNKPATIVFWGDGTKTVVKCKEGTEFNVYNAVTAAVAIKTYGSNSRLNKMIRTKQIIEK